MLPDPHLCFTWEGPHPPVENSPGVLVLHPKSGEPYLARTATLKRRLTRLSHLFDLAALSARVEIWHTPSRLEQALLFYAAAKRYAPDSYRKILRLPSPPYLKLIKSNAFPRLVVTSRLAGKESLFFGPFRNRAEAERYGNEMLDFFQLRRCEEDLSPHPDHPGCIYGEMNQCLRPCQAAVGVGEYSSEVLRLEHTLASGGESLKESIAHARDRSSAQMEFEEAARQHKRFERAEALLRSASEITAPLSQVNGVSAVRRDSGVDLYFLLGGAWLEPVAFDLRQKAGESMDRRLRDIVDALPDPQPSLKQREEHLALLQRWYFSSWRDSEWLAFPSRAEMPYRKLVRLISRTLSPSADRSANMENNASPRTPDS